MDYIGIRNCKNFFMDFMFVSIKEDRRERKKSHKGRTKRKRLSMKVVKMENERSMVVSLKLWIN